MSQDQWIILLFKIILIVDVLAIAGFVIEYWRLAPWWRNPIGRTIVIKDLLLMFALLPSVLSIFFQFNRLDSVIAAWVDVVLIGLIGPVMIWRSVVWQRIHGRKIPDEWGDG